MFVSAAPLVRSSASSSVVASTSTPAVCSIASRRAPAAVQLATARTFFGNSTTFQAAVASSPRFFSFAAPTIMANLKNYKVFDIEKKEVDLSVYLGKVVLIVNVACECGLTSSNYDQLAQLYEKYKAKGLEVMAFPCNQFGQQEPGTNAEIKSFATGKGASFPLMDKVEVNGANAIPLYKDFLKAKFPGDIKWNFGKFLVNKKGEVVQRYEPTVAPNDIVADIEKLLAE
eukprot:tig00000241_g20980.t1